MIFIVFVVTGLATARWDAVISFDRLIGQRNIDSLYGCLLLF